MKVMYKSNKCNYKFILISLLNILIIMGIFGLNSCTKMDATYGKFWKDGEKIYPASPDSLKVFSGKDRVKLQWLNIGDPTLKRAVIYWNNHSDSLAIPIEKNNTVGVDTMSIFIESLAEGTYSFDVYTYDQYGNQSVVANAVGRVYGNSYSKSLLTRLVDNNSFIDDILHIKWGDPADASSIGVEVSYTGMDGNNQTKFVTPNAETTTITDLDFSADKHFRYRTLFVPDSTAIDTFYTKYDTIRILGPRAELSKTDWTVTASSYDNRGGRTDRLPEKLIDENTATAWVNAVGPTDFPHTATIDMGSIQTDIYGISLFTNGAGENPRSMSIYTSDDNENWQPFGLKDIGKIKKEWQYFDFSQPQNFRYLKLVFENSYGSANIILYEAGVYTR